MIPVYNVEAWIRECLDSLILQTYVDWEAVCVDDGSDDLSGAILDEYAAKDDRIKVLHQSNRGVSAARNVALDNAKGEWIAFLDADDTIEADWFERMMMNAKDGVDMVHADSRHCFGNIGVYEDRTYRTFLRGGWSVLNFVRREFVKDVRYVVGMRFKEDVVFFAKLALNAKRIAWVKEKGYHYRERKGSAIAAFVSEDDCVRFWRELKKLRLPCDDFARTLGYDLILWMKGRNRAERYDGKRCAVRSYWRKGMASGELKYGDVRFWWRPGLWVWINAGSLKALEITLFFRTWSECLFRSLLGK